MVDVACRGAFNFPPCPPATGTGDVTGATNIGAGAGVFESETGAGVLQLRSLTGIAGLVATAGATEIELDAAALLPRDGSRAMTGPLDMGAQDVTNVGTVDGVTVQAHGARHLPAGADPLTTGAAGTLAIGDAAGGGSANAFARSDHQHAFPAPAAPVNVTKAAAAAGAATTAARADHKHDVATAAPDGNGVAFGNTATEGTSTSLARADHRHTFTAPGAPVDVTKAAAAAGVAVAAARADHKHDVATGVPLNVGSANAEGTATTLARSDHVHAMPAGFAVMVYCGGASMGAGDVGKWFAAQGDSAGPKQTALGPGSSMVVGIAGTLKRLTWNTATGDATTVFKVFKNGVLAETKTLTGALGTVTLTTAMAIGDRFAVQYDSGTAPGATVVQIYAG